MIIGSRAKDYYI